MNDFTFKKGDVFPSLELGLTDDVGEAIDLGTATAKLRLRRVGDKEPLFTSDMVVVTAAEGLLRYDWADGDTDEAGLYEAEVIVDDSGDLQTFPGDRFWMIEIKANADGDDEDAPDLVFCTAAQARSILGQDLPLRELAVAQFIMSLRTGIQPASDGSTLQYDFLCLRDQIGLRQATAAQARWMLGRVDAVLEQINVSQESSDGESQSLAPNAGWLAPLAEMALNGTSFSRNRPGVINVIAEQSYYRRGVDTGWRPLK